MGTERTDELYKVLLTKGYPKEFCAEIACPNPQSFQVLSGISERILCRNSL